MTMRLISVVILLSSCGATHTIVNKIKTHPMHTLDPPPGHIILLNTFDVKAQKYRDNKDELFSNMINGMLGGMESDLKLNRSVSATALKGFTRTGNTPPERDSTVHALKSQYQATHAIVVTSFNIYFDQTGVEVTETEDGKNREAFYDIVSEINYSVYDARDLFMEVPMNIRRFHSSRTVVSGLLAAGPNIVKNTDDALTMVIENQRKLLNTFFPGAEDRVRPMFTGSPFESVGDALKKNDYNTAMQQCLRFINDPKKLIAAKANYNCAVLSEHDNLPMAARGYLEESLRYFQLQEAVIMMHDYSDSEH